jgi:hypothetical protein
MALKQRAAHNSVVKAEERLTRMREHLNRAHDELDRRGPGRPPPSAARLALGQQEVDTARHEYQRLSAQREQILHSIRTIGHAYHFVDLERGVRRNGKLIAGDIHAQIDRIRAIAQQEGLSQTWASIIASAT